MNSIIKNQIGLISEMFDSVMDVGIIVGENQNIDSVGASLGLYLALTDAGKNVQIVSKKAPIVEVSNLFGVDKIENSFQGNTKILTISVPYRDGEIEKVSYNIEGDRLFVNLFAEEAGISFSEREIQYLRKGSSPSLIIAIGVSTEEEIGAFVDPKSVKTIYIDRNPLNTMVGDVSLIDSSFSSLSEVVAEVLKELSISADADALQNLMDGITYATRNFTLPSTSAFAFEGAGFLLSNGAKRKEGRQRTQERDLGRRQHNDRRNNFPRPDQLINQDRDNRSNQDQDRQQMGQRSSANSNNNQPQPQPQPQVQPQTWTDGSFDDQASTPREMGDVEANDEITDSNFTEGSIPENIPDDWFLPKVFKGSKKGN